jgi:transposase
LDAHYPAKPKGHRRVDLRRVLNGIIFRLRTGCQWNHLPQEFGDDSTMHRHFQHWCHQGLFARLWAVLVQDWVVLHKTNHVERFNNTLRQRVSRLVRDTLSFSQKLANHAGAIWRWTRPLRLGRISHIPEIILAL